MSTPQNAPPSNYSSPPSATASPLDPSPAAASKKPIQPNAQNQYTVTKANLPLACPMSNMYLWNSHPRVYLPIEKSGWAKCPYCSAEYTLQQ